MTEYFVYECQVPNPEVRRFAYVEDPLSFATSGFNPSTMKFTGVKVEANNHKEANEVYNNPTSGNYFIADEPSATKLKALANDVRQRATQAVLNALVVTCTKQVAILNRLLSILAKTTFQSSNGMVSAQDLHAIFKHKLMKNMKYDPKCDGSKD
jgi:hypothetical protein